MCRQEPGLTVKLLLLSWRDHQSNTGTVSQDQILREDDHKEY